MDNPHAQGIGSVMAAGGRLKGISDKNCVHMTEFGEKQWSTQKKWEGAHSTDYICTKVACCVVS